LETVEISIELRQAGGKRDARRLRRAGKLPGVFYGPKSAPVPLQVEGKELKSRVSVLEGSHLIRMRSEASLLEDKVALIKGVQFHPVSGDVLHIDFYEVDLAEKIMVKIPLHFVGKAEGVVKGGILQPVVREIEVECLPIDIPEYINVEVTSLDIGHSLHVSDLAIPEGVTAVYDSDFALVTILAPTVVEEAKVEEAPAVAPGIETPSPAPEEKSK
jgi:large subunit ribosomal protein L25